MTSIGSVWKTCGRIDVGTAIQRLLLALAAAALIFVNSPQLFSQNTKNNPQLPPQSQYQIKRTAPLQAQRLHIKLGLSQPFVRPVEHDPAEPPVPLPAGPFRPWKNIGPPTELQEVNPGNLQLGKISKVHERGNPTGGGVEDDAVNVSAQLNTYPYWNNNWETMAASSGEVVLYSSNWDDAFSTDGGQTFTEVDARALMASVSADPGGNAFCCDQVAQYVPSIDRLILVMQSNPLSTTGENEYRLIFASPGDIKKNGGSTLSLNVYDLTSKYFNVPGMALDYPEIAVGEDYLYMSFNVVGNASIIARIPLSSFVTGTMPGADYLLIKGSYWMRPVQNTGKRGIFAFQTSTSQLRLISWEGNSLVTVDSNINTIPTLNQSSIVPPPGGGDWLATTTKWSTHIYGATQAGNQIWLAWNAARSYPGDPVPVFAQPHVELAVLDATKLSLIYQFLIYNSNYAFAWPALATNAEGEVGIVVAAGGGDRQVEPVIGFLSNPLILATVPTGISPSNGSGGHFSGIRPLPNTTCFSGAVFAGMSGTAKAFYVPFGRNGCTPSSTPLAPQNCTVFGVFCEHEATLQCDPLPDSQMLVFSASIDVQPPNFVGAGITYGTPQAPASLVYDAAIDPSDDVFQACAADPTSSTPPQCTWPVTYVPDSNPKCASGGGHKPPPPPPTPRQCIQAGCQPNPHGKGCICQ